MTQTRACSVTEALGVFQEKWALHLVFALLPGEAGFNELHRRIVGGINTTTLAQRLARLEEVGLLTRCTESGFPARTAYALTPVGRDLEGVIREIARWATEALPHSEVESGCGHPPEALHVARAVEIVQEKWTLTIVHTLLAKPRHFNDLVRDIPGMGPSSLGRRLERLESLGLVSRTVQSVQPPRTLYALTARGQALKDVIGALHRWATRHFTASGVTAIA